jgi:uncharacterized protein
MGSMHAHRQDRLAEVLDHVVETLITEYEPERIVLFGSLATGRVGEWSDLDLVVIKETPRPFLQRLKEVALLCRAFVSVDYLVYTPGEFAQLVAEENPFILEVLREGKVIYERQAAEAMARAG